MDKRYVLKFMKIKLSQPSSFADRTYVHSGLSRPTNTTLEHFVLVKKLFPSASWLGRGARYGSNFLDFNLNRSRYPSQFLKRQLRYSCFCVCRAEPSRGTNIQTARRESVSYFRVKAMTICLARFSRCKADPHSYRVART